MKHITFIVIALSFLISLTEVLASEGVANVIIVRGEVKAKEKDGNIVTVTKGMWLKEGSVLQSAAKSFAKLLFVDKSEMSLGPESQMVITSFPKDQAGILTLVKGQLRSKVTKDYMEITDKEKSKLYIKTQSAAMGVRGTDFQVNFDNASKATTLITFSGAVAMSKLSESAGKVFDRNMLEQSLRSKEAVLVQKGEFAGTSPKTTVVSPPEKLPADKLETLNKSEGAVIVKEMIKELATQATSEVKEEKKEEQKEEKKEEKKDEKKKQDEPKTTAVRSIVPPGLSASMVGNQGGAELEKALVSNLGTQAVSEIKTAVASEMKDPSRAPASFEGATFNMPPPPSSFLPPPPPPTINQDKFVEERDKFYNNAPPPVNVDTNGRVRFIFH